MSRPLSTTALWRRTLVQLLHPSRLVPILALAVPLVLSQHQFSQDAVLADLISVGLVIGFLVFGPFSWRALRPSPLFVVWPLLGLVPFGIGMAMTLLVEAQPTFLLGSITGLMTAALFLVGSWGLGRDLDLSDRAEELEQAARSAQILAMQAHLDPHFLFNTLNAIAEWCVIDGHRAEQAILDLSAVLRTITQAIQVRRWPLQRELALCRQVLQLHHARDPERFRFDVADVKGPMVPPLLLLPLVENAVTHGPGKGYSGRVRIEVELGEEQVIRVHNPGPFGGPRAGGVGLAQVRDRLRLELGGRLEVSSDESTTVTLRWRNA